MHDLFKFCLLLFMFCFASLGCSSDPFPDRSTKTLFGDSKSGFFPDRGFGQGGWSAEMPFEDKEQFMSEVWYPQMSQLFIRFDVRYKQHENLHCGTCHGENKLTAKPDFSKPTSLFPLNPNHLPSRDDKDPKVAAMVKFMEDEVTPLASALLNKPVDCFACHAIKID